MTKAGVLCNTHVLIKKYKLHKNILKRTYVQSVRNGSKVTLVCTRFYRVLRVVECHSQNHVVPGRCPSLVVPEGTLTHTFRSYMFLFVPHLRTRTKPVSETLCYFRCLLVYQGWPAQNSCGRRTLGSNLGTNHAPIFFFA